MDTSKATPTRIPVGARRIPPIRVVIPPLITVLLAGITTLWLAVHAAPVTTLSRSPEPAPAALMFIQNVGQFRSGALFQSQSELGTLFLAKDALWITALEPLDATALEAIEAGLEPPPRAGVNLRLSFVGANPQPQIEPFMPLTTSVNYLRGNDPAKWFRHVPVS